MSVQVANPHSGSSRHAFQYMDTNGITLYHLGMSTESFLKTTKAQGLAKVFITKHYYPLVI